MGGRRLKIMTWNILAELYSTASAFSYCESYVLAWAYRRQRILKEILTYKPDIVCLQEVQREHYEEYLLPLLSAEGYGGVYKQKTTEIFAAGGGRKKGGRFTMDGCATFYLKSNLELVDSSGLEFAELVKAACTPQLSRHRMQGAAKRLLKDNVALLLLLQLLEGDAETDGNSNKRRAAADTSSSSSNPRFVLVGNTHVAASPDSNDAKIWQTQTLMGVIERYLLAFGGAPPALLLCGDFNSSPDSAVYELLLRGCCTRQHSDLMADRHGLLTDVELRHGVRIKSAYAMSKALCEDLDGADFVVSRQCEPAFTNYTSNFCGCLDYIFYSDEQLRPRAVVEPVSERQLFQEAQALQLSSPALPSPLRPSDHIPLVAEFEWIPTQDSI